MALGDDNNDTIQTIVEALQDLDLMQRVADYARGRERDGTPWQERLDALCKEIY
jgi:hypothetical protein